ncbi:MAG: AMP-binding protein [Streptosporangiaceae bacterium]
MPTPLTTGFIEAVRRRPEVLRTLGGVLHSASAMPPDLARELAGVIGGRYLETWGMTETGAPVTATAPTDWDPDCAADDVYASVGRPAPIASVRVLDSAGRPLPAGRTGELAVESDTLFAGYHRRPDLTAEVRDGRWFRTGDLGRLDEAGYVYLTGRLKEMIITGGRNVYPAEVDQVVRELPGVADAAAFGLPDPRWGETVALAVVPRPGHTLDPAAVTAFVAGRLASYKKPRRVFLVDALPRNAALKVQRHLLRERLGGLRS